MQLSDKTVRRIENAAIGFIAFNAIAYIVLAYLV